MRKLAALIMPLVPLMASSLFLPPSRAQKRSQSASSATAQVTPEDEVVRVDTNLVTIPASIKDRHGKLVTDLRREDFQIYEDGVPQEIAYFDPPDAPGGARAESSDKPLTLALMLDVSDSTELKLGQIQDSVLGFINLLGKGDRVLAVAFDKRVQLLTEPTLDRDLLRTVIKRTRTGGGTSLYSALDTVITNRLNHIGGRKAIVLFTDGVDTSSAGATYESTMREAEQLDAVIYPIQFNTYGDFADNPSRQTYALGNLGGVAHATRNGELASDAYKRATLYLRWLADTTGGRFQYADSTENLARSFARIASELRQQYTLGYYPKNRMVDGMRRRIKVEVGVPGITVLARKSYLSKASAVASGKP